MRSSLAQLRYLAQPLKRKRAIASSAGGRAPHEARPKVARPTAVGGKAEKVDPIERDAGTRQQAAGLALVLRGVDENPHHLAGYEPAHDFGVDEWNDGDLARPIGRVVRPADPGGVMLLPLGGHDDDVRHQTLDVSFLWGLLTSDV
jgi:hypothetical protein